jgi:hypothetical protein
MKLLQELDLSIISLGAINTGEPPALSISLRNLNSYTMIINSRIAEDTDVSPPGHQDPPLAPTEGTTKNSEKSDPRADSKILVVIVVISVS